MNHSLDGVNAKIDPEILKDGLDANCEGRHCELKNSQGRQERQGDVQQRGQLPESCVRGGQIVTDAHGRRFYAVEDGIEGRVYKKID